MDFSNKEIYNYIDNHSSDESDILYELRRETELKCLNPIMLSGKIQGNFLAIISKLIKPFNVLEIGTYTGYSTLCIAEGLNPAGMIHTIDKNEELLQIQNKYFEKSGLRSQIKQYTGDALAIIPKLKFDFDMVFLDANKENYVKYLELISPILKPGGVLLTDNVLWHGKILESSENQDRVTRLIDNFNKKIVEDKSLKTVMLPIRDGISLTLKL
ncbi:MAG: methyltransferase [Flavobacteriaceae bacterium]|jgi:caffeoyl-CoA O-methyltransferase|nr:methyltransferase [Flavobacteriaceae bacterium]OUV87067.1 MAG: methyltransferase [Flavobacteriaceae bacterium TMED145]|tara:strand:- start:5089 stop:5730 length:642 start_codon:yes stop_codon:yes gene_type:complete